MKRAAIWRRHRDEPPNLFSSKDVLPSSRGCGQQTDDSYKLLQRMSLAEVRPFTWKPTCAKKGGDTKMQSFGPNMKQL